jgi:hypothetical protein
MYVGWEGKEILTVNNIHLFCGIASTTQEPSEFPAAKFDGPEEERTGAFGTFVGRGDDTQRCPAGLVAVGINGRSDDRWLDAVGLICGEPKLTPRPVALGRVQITTPKGPPMSICARARDARARNSPVAPSLEAQCRTYLKSHPRENPSLVLRKPQDPIRINNGALVLGKPDVNAPAAPAPKGPAITADTNPVMVAKGQDSGTTTITWKAAPDYNYCEIYLSVDNGEWSEFARGGDGSKATTIKLGSTYTFRMMVYEGQEGTPKIITSLTVTAKN